MEHFHVQMISAQTGLVFKRDILQNFLQICGMCLLLWSGNIYHYVVLFGEGSVSEMGEDIWTSGSCMSFKENTMPCLKLDTSAKLCNGTQRLLHRLEFDFSISKSMQTCSPIINLRGWVNFGQILPPCCHTGRSLLAGRDLLSVSSCSWVCLNQLIWARHNKWCSMPLAVRWQITHLNK